MFFTLSGTPCVVRDYSTATCQTLTINAPAQGNSLSNLAVGDIFNAADYTITVTEATGGATGWSGKGYVSVLLPMGVTQNVAVTFDNIAINDCYELVNGKVETEYDPNKEISDVDLIMQGLQMVLDNISSILENYTGSTEEKDKLLEEMTNLAAYKNNNLLAPLKSNLTALHSQSCSAPVSIIDSKGARLANVTACEALIEDIKEELNEINNNIDSSYKIPAPQWIISKRLEQNPAWKKAYEALTKMGLWKEMKIDYMRGNTYIDLYFLTGNCGTILNADGTVDAGLHAETHLMKNTSSFGPPTNTKEQLLDFYFNKNNTPDFVTNVQIPMIEASEDYANVYDNFIKRRLKEKKFPIFITICSRVLEGALISEQAMKELCHTICHEIDAHAKFYVKDDLMKTTTASKDHQNFYSLSQPQSDSPNYRVIKQLSRAFYFKNIIENYFKIK